MITRKHRITTAAIAATVLGILMAAAEITIDSGPQKSATGPRIDVPKPAGSATTPARGPAKRSPLGDLLQFKDGDSLHGNLVSVDAAEGMVWSRPDVEDPIKIKDLARLNGVRLQALAKPQSNAGAARIYLTNGDMLYGNIVGLTAETAILQSWYAGQVTIQKPMIESIQPGAKSGGVVFTGPGKLADWTRNGNWQIKRGALSGSGTIGRDLKLPDKSRLEFDMAWQGRYLNFSMTLYTKDLKQNQGDGYMMNFSNNTVRLYRRIRNQGQHDLGYANNVNALTKRQRLHVDIRTDKEEKSIVLMINGKRVHQWIDSQDFAGRGTGMLIYAHDRSSTIAFSKMRVSPWDGKFESTDKSQDTDEDAIQLVNGDKVSGSLLSIRDGRIAFKTDYGNLDLPVQRAGLITLATKGQERARRNRDDVRAYFPDGAYVTVKLANIGDGRLAGSSENFGDLTFEVKAFIGVEFNIYDKKKKKKDEDDGLLIPTGMDFQDLLFEQGGVQFEIQGGRQQAPAVQVHNVHGRRLIDWRQ